MVTLAEAAQAARKADEAKAQRKQDPALECRTFTVQKCVGAFHGHGVIPNCGVPGICRREPPRAPDGMLCARRRAGQWNRQGVAP